VEKQERIGRKIQNGGKIKKNTNFGGGGKEHVLLDGSHVPTARPYDRSGTKVNALKWCSQQHDTRAAEF
jgi:hypothetical protein